MLRKIRFLVPTFAFILLAVSRLGGLAGKAGAGGLAWAQDSSATDDGVQNDSGDITDSTSGIKFTGSGAFAATVVTPCAEDACYSLSGTVKKTSIKGLAPGDLSGTVTLSSCTIAHHRECCAFASTQTYSFTEGDLGVTFGGVACGSKPTKVTAKNAAFEITSGSGLFSTASGSGKATFHFNEDTGEGKFKFKGRLTE